MAFKINNTTVINDSKSLENISSVDSTTAASVLAGLLLVDGAASGLDADTLDGIQGSYFYSPDNQQPSVDPTTAQVGDASASLAFGAVGSYGMFRHTATTSLTEGTLVGGGSLLPVSASNNNVGTSNPSGTWRAMGRTLYTAATTGTRSQPAQPAYYGNTIFLRTV
jgi:hypothetical protein